MAVDPNGKIIVYPSDQDTKERGSSKKNDRSEFVSVSEITGAVEVTYQTAITSSQNLTGTENGIHNVYPVDSSGGAITLTVTTGTWALNDIVILERRGYNDVEIVAGTGVIIRGKRNIDNKFFIDNSAMGSVYLICRGTVDGNLEFSIVGDLTGGATQLTTSNYTALEPAETANVTVTGTGFSANMPDPVLTGNATLNSWVYDNYTQITLNITSSGSDSDTLTLVYDNFDGQKFTDTDAITLTAATPAWNLTNITQSTDDFTSTTATTWAAIGTLDTAITGDGSIECQYLTSNNAPMKLILADTYPLTAHNSNAPYGIQISGTTIYRTENGAFTSLSTTISANDKIRIRIDDAADQAIIEHDTGGGYTTLYTYTSVTGTYYPAIAMNGNGKVIQNVVTTL